MSLVVSCCQQNNSIPEHKEQRQLKSQSLLLPWVQNAAARLVYNAGKHCHITPLLFKLHWLPIRERIVFKILLITYKAVHGHAPNYIKELIKFKKPGKYNLRSNSDNLLLEIEKVKTYTTLGDRAFQVAAPKLWNNLPINIRSSLFLPSFKKALKTYLFREAFS